MLLRKLSCLGFIAAAVALTTMPIFAQNYRAQVRGLITDQSGAVLPGANVTLSNVKTGISAAKQSDGAGLYVFDFVDPGTYTISVDAAGFGKFVQENIAVQSAGDVTVNAVLTPGALQQTVTVEAAPPAVEFNSSSVELTIDTKMANDTPRIDRNPFKLTLLEPAAINTRGEMAPYASWAPNSVELGGDTNLRNNLLVDGNPIGIGHKAGYPPNQDDVQESVVSQNSVDAASGHSAGGLISLTTKAGTNEWHGSAFYLGRYPWLSAVADRTRFVDNPQRQNVIGGTLGDPIIKNKLFNFFSIEDWKIHAPASYSVTVPTALERQGDFSQTYAADGTLRVIYDPTTTVVDANGNVTRQRFQGNKIQPNRFDPVSATFLSSFPNPNNPGVGYNHLNNFQKGITQTTDYLNFSDRVDYNINDKWRVSGYYGRYHAQDSQTDPIPGNTTLYQPAGSLRGANQVLGDVIWSISPNTVLNVHGDWFNLVDAYVSKGVSTSVWQGIWPNNPWYAPYLNASKNVPLYYPKLSIGPSSFGGPGFFWDQRPAAEAFSAELTHTSGSHYLKYGFQFRRGSGANFVSNTNNFIFNQALTANTFNSPDLTKSGDAFATFLLGALDSSTQMVGGPSPITTSDFFGFYVGDDWKISRKLTLTLGLRDEYDTAWHDPNHQLSRGLDLTKIDPAIQANPPQMPSTVTDIVGQNYTSYNGLWNFTSSSHPGMWNAPKLNLQPRFGAAYRLNDNTALRFGYALYTVSSEYNFTPAPISGFEDVNFLEPPFFGMTGYQNVLPLANGVPQAYLSNPYPANSNPLVPIAGKSTGTNVGRGGSPLLWYPQDFEKEYNNRLNFTVEHQLPGQFVASVTYFLNFGNHAYNKALNNLDPAIAQKYSPSYLSQSVANPFYHYLSATTLPGPLYNQATVPLSSLLVKYPLYGPLYEIGVRGASERYQDIELKLQKRFSRGFNFLFGYIYIREKAQINNFNDQTLFNNQLVWQDSDQPRHRITSAGTYELPFGKGRTYLSNSGHIADAVIGGWQVTGAFTFTSGNFPRFGNYIVSGNPCQGVPSGDYFNPAVFSNPPANTYTMRTNPEQYSCIVGPNFTNLDATLQKNFHVTERVAAELKMTAYNALNKLNYGSPDTNLNDGAQFGKSLYQGAPAGQFAGQTATYGNQAGRQIELGLRFIF